MFISENDFSVVCPTRQGLDGERCQVATVQRSSGSSESVKKHISSRNHTYKYRTGLPAVLRARVHANDDG